MVSEGISLRTHEALLFSESPHHITDGVTLNILRALQGIGGAAIIPAAVRPLSFFAFPIQRLTLFLVLRRLGF